MALSLLLFLSRHASVNDRPLSFTSHRHYTKATQLAAGSQDGWKADLQFTQGEALDIIFFYVVNTFHPLITMLPPSFPKSVYTLGTGDRTTRRADLSRGGPNLQKKSGL